MALLDSKKTFNLPVWKESPFPYSQAVRAGPLIFTSGHLATDYRSGIAAEATSNPHRPFDGPPAISRQTRHVFGQLRCVLELAGSSLNELIRVEQFITRRSDAAGFVDTRREFLDLDPPTSSLLVANDLELPDARILVGGIALQRDERWRKQAFKTDKVPVNKRGGYSLALCAGPLVFLPGNTASDFTTGIHSEAHADPTFWFERDIVKQTEFILKTRRILLEEMGLSLADVVQATIYITELNDLPELETVWRRHFPGDGPSIAVVPVAELAVRGSVVEISVTALDPRKGQSKRAIRVGGASQTQFGAPSAVQAGPYLFFSAISASGPDGLVPEATANPHIPYYSSPIKLQARHIFRNVAAACDAAGVSTDHLVHCQTLLTDLSDLVAYFEVWREVFSTAPPASTVIRAASPLIIPGCRISQCWIAYVPENPGRP